MNYKKTISLLLFALSLMNVSGQFKYSPPKKDSIVYKRLRLSESRTKNNTNTKESNPVLSFMLLKNPVIDFLKLEFKSDRDKEVFVFASTGQQLKSSTLSKSGTIDFSDFPSGIYILAVKQDHVYSHFKIIHTQVPSH